MYPYFFRFVFNFPFLMISFLTFQEELRLSRYITGSELGGRVSEL